MTAWNIIGLISTWFIAGAAVVTVLRAKKLDVKIKRLVKFLDPRREEMLKELLRNRDGKQVERFYRNNLLRGNDVDWVLHYFSRDGLLRDSPSFPKRRKLQDNFISKKGYNPFYKENS